jgi:hypothetical protein
MDQSSQQQYSINKCRSIRTGKLVQYLMQSCPTTGPHGSNLAPARRFPTFLSGSTVLQGNTHQAGHYVVETDQFRGIVRALHAKKDFGWLIVVVDADVECPLLGDLDLLRDLIPAGW